MESFRAYNVSEIDELKLIYYEIIRGSSFEPDINLYVKHFSELESFLILKKRTELFHFYSKEGVPHELELLKNAMTTEEWSEEKENKILELKYLISDNEKNIHNIIIEQRAPIEKIIDDAKKQLNEILYDRKGILGRSIEDLIDDDIEDYLSYLSFFKDEPCTIPCLPDYKEFEKLEPSEINKFNISLSKTYKRFSEENIKKIACLPFFLNKFSYSKERIDGFLGKPVNSLTNNQTSLFSLGVRNLNVLSHAKGSPPDISLEAKPLDVLKWYDIQHSIMIAKQNQSDS